MTQVLPDLRKQANAYYFVIKQAKDFLGDGLWWGIGGAADLSKFGRFVGNAPPDILSFKFSAEEMQIPVASFSILDNLGILDDKIRRGVPITGEFGVNYGAMIDFSFTQRGRNDIVGAGLHSFGGRVITAMGHFQGGNHIRDIVVSCGTNPDNRDQIDSRAYPKPGTTTTLKKIIEELLEELGARVSFIKFTDMDKPITDETALMRTNETAVAFLRRIAYQKNKNLIILDTADGVFVCMKDYENKAIPKVLNARRAQGLYHIIDLNQNIVGDPSYDLGDGSSMGSVPEFGVDASGRQTIRFLAAETDTTVQYTFNAEATKDYAGGKDRAWADIQNLMRVNQFRVGDDINEKIRPFFIKETFTTAPEQMGYQFSCSIVPNPEIHVGDPVHLGPEDPEEAQRSHLPPVLKSCRSANGKDALPLLWRVHSFEWTHDGSGVTQTLKLRR